jgi:hypothetical protein
VTNLTAKRGDTNRYTTTITRSGAGVDLTNAALTFTVKRRKSDADVDALIQKSVASGALDSSLGMVKATQSGATLGEVTTTIAAGDTDDLTAESTVLYYDIQMIEGSGSSAVVTTVDEGTFTVSADVTRAIV